jgi:hypothetical protein
MLNDMFHKKIETAKKTMNLFSDNQDRILSIIKLINLIKLFLFLFLFFFLFLYFLFYIVS